MTFNFTPSSTEDSDCENPTLLETVTQYLVITYNGKESKKNLKKSSMC